MYTFRRTKVSIWSIFIFFLLRLTFYSSFFCLFGVKANVSTYLTNCPEGMNSLKGCSVFFQLVFSWSSVHLSTFFPYFAKHCILPFVSLFFFSIFGCHRSATSTIIRLCSTESQLKPETRMSPLCLSIIGRCDENVHQNFRAETTGYQYWIIESAPTR